MRLRKNTWIPQYLKTVDFLPGHKVSAEEWNALFNLSRIQGNNNAEGIKLLMDTVEGAIELPSILYDYDSRIKEMEDKVKGFNDEHVIDLVSKHYVSKDDYTNATGSIKKLQESLVEVEKKITQEAIIDTVKGTYVTKTDFETATKDISLLEEKLTKAEQKITDEAITSTVSANFYKKTEIDKQVLEQKEFLQSEIKQTSKSILSTVEETYTTKDDSDKRFTRVEQTVNGVTITDPDGTTRIDGNSIDVESLFARDITSTGNFNMGGNGALVYDYEKDELSIRVKEFVIESSGKTLDEELEDIKQEKVINVGARNLIRNSKHMMFDSYGFGHDDFEPFPLKAPTISIDQPKLGRPKISLYTARLGRPNIYLETVSDGKLDAPNIYLSTTGGGTSAVLGKAILGQMVLGRDNTSAVLGEAVLGEMELGNGLIQLDAPVIELVG